MGFFSNLFRSKPKQVSRVSPPAKPTARPKPTIKPAPTIQSASHIKTSGDLLKAATQFKKDGDWDSALSSLEKAYLLMQSDGVDRSAATYLRYPKYLFEAGRGDEAWREYEEALEEGLGGIAPGNFMKYVEHSQIYGSMALQRKREKRFFESAVYQAASSLAWDKGMIAQKRPVTYDAISFESAMLKTLKKDKDVERHEKLLTLGHIALESPKKHTPENFIQEALKE